METPPMRVKTSPKQAIYDWLKSSENLRKSMEDLFEIIENYFRSLSFPMAAWIGPR
jgi:hypothetical protein